MPLRVRLAACTAVAVLLAGRALPGQSTVSRYQADADRIIAAALADSAAWKRIAELTDTFGPRLAGSDALERAIDWMLVQMKADGLANVRGEPVMVPHWVRGAESAELVSPRRKRMALLGLGGRLACERLQKLEPVALVGGDVVALGQLAHLLMQRIRQAQADAAHGTTPIR